jgi:hypothetical protein
VGRSRALRTPACERRRHPVQARHGRGGQPNSDPQDAGGSLSSTGLVSTTNFSHHDSPSRTTVRAENVTTATCSHSSPVVGPVGLEPATSGLKGFRYPAIRASTSNYVHSGCHRPHHSATVDVVSHHDPHHATPADVDERPHLVEELPLELRGPQDRA